MIRAVAVARGGRAVRRARPPGAPKRVVVAALRSQSSLMLPVRGLFQFGRVAAPPRARGVVACVDSAAGR